MTNTIMVEANYDFATKVWFVASCDLFGVHAEGSTFDALCNKLPGIVRATIEADSDSDSIAGERLEIVVHASIRIVV
jgi:predicted RNase H-like HicB family nuclease